MPNLSSQGWMPPHPLTVCLSDLMVSFHVINLIDKFLCMFKEKERNNFLSKTNRMVLGW